jgi:hypothetical protein
MTNLTFDELPDAVASAVGNIFYGISDNATLIVTAMVLLIVVGAASGAFAAIGRMINGFKVK